MRKLDLAIWFAAGCLILSLGAKASDVSLHVFKDPNCGCCTKWIDHLHEADINATHTETGQMSAIKAKYGIARPHQSCHTAISKQGYLFEGHVPAKLVKQFLQQPPEDAIGLTVPGMPVGSPGMEMDNRFQPYQVLQIQKDGSVRVYQEVHFYQEQF